MQASPVSRLSVRSAPAIQAEPSAPHSTERPPQQVWRLWLVVAGFGLLTTLVVARLVHHTVAGWMGYTDRTVYADGALPRGVIVDRNGQLLAADRFSYTIVADPSALRGEAERLAVAQKLQELIGVSAAETNTKLFEAGESRYVELAKGVSLELSQRVLAFKAQDSAENDIPLLRGVDILPVPERYYPQGALASHMLGFVSAEHGGAYGLEEYYNSYLDPRRRIGLLEKTDERVDSLPATVRRFVPSMGGKDLVLTLDTGVQWIIEDEVQKAITKFKAESGTIIVMEPQTGAILGMTSWPPYDPNHYGENPDYSRFTDSAVSRLYEPGSIFKVITMAAALDTGIVTPTTTFIDRGSITVGERVIFNSSRVGYGEVTATEALARSLNVVTAQIAEGLGSDRFYRYVERFGFEELTEIDLADEVSGLVKSPGNPQWSMSDLGTNSFGQGLAITPIEMINSVSVIANGGKLMRPYVVQARVADERVLVTQPTVVRTAIKPETAHQLTQMMVATVRTGNAAAGVAGYRVAGKSGTAQIPSPDGYEEEATIVSFIGFAPADDPRFAILVKLDRPDPKISIWATHTAAPVFSQVARRLFDYLNVPPDEVRLGKERVAELEAEIFGSDEVLDLRY